MSNQEALAPRPRLAIIGGGSSGLISLKYALDHLPTWEIACFEQSDQYVGCWGRPYPGFVSTSTRYTTQFALLSSHGRSGQRHWCEDVRRVFSRR